ncbi:MAG: ATP-binding protein [Nannocystis sp.]|nr:ATP-binding protein [Nannocystis sp.]
MFGVFAGLEYPRLNERAMFPGARELCLHLSVRSKELGGHRSLRLVIGDEKFQHAHALPGCYALGRRGPEARAPDGWLEFLEAAKNPVLIARGAMPRVIYFPTDRQLVFPTSNKRSLERPADPNQMAWRFVPASTYEESLINFLTWERFEDLSAKEEGTTEHATHFAAYADAFHRFVGGGKQLIWQRGNLMVRTADGTMHGMPELSSGEKQVLLFAADLHRRWSPGALVLIDEPELHLHDAWQSTLFRFICDLQRERGGQVILATQSSHFFGLGEVGSKIVLRKGWP